MKKNIIVFILSIVTFGTLLSIDDRNGVFDFVPSRDFQDVVEILKKDGKTIYSMSDTDLELYQEEEIRENALNCHEVHTNDNHDTLISQEFTGNLLVAQNPYVSSFFLFDSSPFAKFCIKTGLFDAYVSFF